MEAVPAGTEELQWDNGGEEGGVWDTEIEGWEERQGDRDADEEITENICKCTHQAKRKKKSVSLLNRIYIKISRSDVQVEIFASF